MPDSRVDTIIDRLREQAARNQEVGYPDAVVHLQAAEAAVHAAADARTQEIVAWLWTDAPLTEAYAREMLSDAVARRFPNGGTHK